MESNSSQFVIGSSRLREQRCFLSYSSRDRFVAADSAACSLLMSIFSEHGVLSHTPDNCCVLRAVANEHAIILQIALGLQMSLRCVITFYLDNVSAHLDRFVRGRSRFFRSRIN